MLADQLVGKFQFFLRQADLEIFCIAKFFYGKHFLKELQGNAVECSVEKRRGVFFYILDLQPFSDLVGCFICKGQNDHIFQGDFFLLVKITDLFDKNRCFSASYVCADQAGIMFIQNRCFLIIIQFHMFHPFSECDICASFFHVLAYLSVSLYL